MPRPVLLGLHLLVSFGAGCLVSVVGPTVPALALMLHVQEDNLGVVFGANFLLASAATALTGRLFDRRGSRVLLPAGILAMALGALGEGLAPSLFLLTLAAGLAGLGTGVMNVGLNATANQLYPERRERVLNVLNALFGAGAFLAPLLTSLALARPGGYLPAYVAVAVLLVLPLPLLLCGLPRQGAAADGQEQGESMRALLARRVLWAPIAIGFLYLGAEVGFGGWIVAILQRAARMSPQDAAPAVAIFWLFLALGGIPTGYLLRHGIAPARIMQGSAALAALAAATLIVFGSVAPVAVVTCALVGLFFAPIFPLTLAAAMHEASARGAGAVGGATSLVLVAAQIGAATVPPLQGLLLRAGPGWALAVTCVCSLLILAARSATLARQPST